MILATKSFFKHLPFESFVIRTTVILELSKWVSLDNKKLAVIRNSQVYTWFSMRRRISHRLKPFTIGVPASRASRIREFAFQLWVIVFQSNSLHRSGRYEFTWRKYRPILHRHVINPSICTYDIVYICVCVCIRWWKSRGIFQARRNRSNPISLRSIVKLALFERSMRGFNSFEFRSKFELSFLLGREPRGFSIFDARAGELIAQYVSFVEIELKNLVFFLSSVNVIRVQFNFQEKRIFR